METCWLAAPISQLLASLHTKSTTPFHQFVEGSRWRHSTDHNHEGHATVAIWCPLILIRTLKVLSRSSVVIEGGHIGGLFYCTRQIIGLESFYSYFSWRAKEGGGEDWKENVPFGISYPGLARPFKEPLRCGFKRNSLCGTGAGRKPSTEETLYCVSAWGANDLACRLKLGVGKGNGMFRFCFVR